MKNYGPKLDDKFQGSLQRMDGSLVDPDEWMVFLAKDDAFLPTLEFYRKECERLKAGEQHLASIDRQIQKVKAWRKSNSIHCKVPD